MKHQLFMVFLASAILVSCTKDEITPYNPDQTPSPIAPKPAPFGKVTAPFVAVSIQDVSGKEFKIEKYRTDGAFRATLLEGYFAEDHFIVNPDLSPFGEKFCYGENQSVYILDVNTLQRQQFAGSVDPGVAIESTELSPDGSAVAYLVRNPDNSYDLSVIENIGESDPLKLTNSGLSDLNAGAPSFNPDGNMIAYAENLNVVVSDLRGENKIRVNEGTTQQASNPIFNADGTRLFYFLNQDHGLTIVSAEVREGGGDDQVMIAFLGRYSISNASHLVLTGDGTTLYFAGISSGHTNLYRVPVAGGVPERVAFNITNSGEYMVSGIDFVGWKAE